MTTRNELLKNIVIATGVSPTAVTRNGLAKQIAGITGDLTRNDILREIVTSLGGASTSDNRNDLIREAIILLGGTPVGNTRNSLLQEQLDITDASSYTQSITMDGGTPNSSQAFAAGNLIFDQLGIKLIEETSGAVVKLIFDSEALRDAYLTTVDTWSMAGTGLSDFNWIDNDTSNFGLICSNARAIVAFAAGTNNFVWTLI